MIRRKQAEIDLLLIRVDQLYYADFIGSPTYPKIKLYNDLLDVGIDLGKNIMDGKYDG